VKTKFLKRKKHYYEMREHYTIKRSKHFSLLLSCSGLSSNSQSELKASWIIQYCCVHTIHTEQPNCLKLPNRNCQGNIEQTLAGPSRKQTERTDSKMKGSTGYIENGGCRQPTRGCPSARRLTVRLIASHRKQITTLRHGMKSAGISGVIWNGKWSLLFLRMLFNDVLVTRLYRAGDVRGRVN
jgi:hypothetical protein